MSVLIKSFESSKKIDLNDESLLKLISGGQCGCKGKVLTATTSEDGTSTSYSVDEA